MSNPSFENIDRWLFELMEGNLSPEQEAQLEAFLLQHPDLDLDRDMWDLAKVESVQPVYQNKKQLEKRRVLFPYFVGAGMISITLLALVLSTFSDDTVISSSAFRKENPSNFKKSSFNLKTLSGSNSIKSGHNESSLTDANNENFDSLQPNVSAQFPIKSEYLTFNSSQTAGISESSLINQAYNDYLPSNSILNKSNFNLLLKPKSAYAALTSSKSSTELSVSSINTKATEVKESKNRSKEFNLSQFGLKSKVKRMVNNIDKAMRNPVALINLKDNWYQVPGLTCTDVNFSSVGSILSTRIQTTSRLQWFGNANQQFSNQIAVDAYAHSLKGGIGFQMNHNYYGDGGIQNYNAALIYSPKIPLSANLVLEPSVRFKMGSKQLDAQALNGISQVELDRFNAVDYYTNGSNPIGRTLWYRDVGAGLMLNTKWFYASFQADNLMQHYDNIYSSEIENPRKAPYQYVATLGGEYMSKKRTASVSPYMVYQKFGDLEEFWGGLNLRYKWAKIGLGLSSNMEPSASIGLRFNHFTMLYSADYTKSAIINKSMLSHQLTLRFNTKPCRIGQRILSR